MTGVQVAQVSEKVLKHSECCRKWREANKERSRLKAKESYAIKKDEKNRKKREKYARDKAARLAAAQAS